MPVIARFTKQPADSKDYDVTYYDWFQDIQGDTLDDVTTVVTQVSGPDGELIEVYNTQLTATVIKLWVRGGAPGGKYKIELTVQTQQGRIDQCEILFSVKET